MAFLARRMHQIHVSLFAEHCAAFRVTPLQYSLLSLLHDLDEADQTTLASAVALDRTTTTGALKRLTARGLVSRSTSPTDRRAQICRLTAEGLALHSAMEPAARMAHAPTVEALLPSEQDRLIKLLRRVINGHEHRRGQATIELDAFMGIVPLELSALDLLIPSRASVALTVALKHRR